MPADSDATPRASRFAWPLLAALGLAWGIAALAGESAGNASGSDDPLRGAQQLVLVTTDGWDDTQGMARRFERPDDAAPWTEVASFPVSIGRHGSAWGTGLHAAGDQAGDVRHVDHQHGVHRIGDADAAAFDREVSA